MPADRISTRLGTSPCFIRRWVCARDGFITRKAAVNSHAACRYGERRHDRSAGQTEHCHRADKRPKQGAQRFLPGRCQGLLRTARLYMTRSNLRAAMTHSSVWKLDLLARSMKHQRVTFAVMAASRQC